MCLSQNWFVVFVLDCQERFALVGIQGKLTVANRVGCGDEPLSLTPPFMRILIRYPSASIRVRRHDRFWPLINSKMKVLLLDPFKAIMGIREVAFTRAGNNNAPVGRDGYIADHPDAHGVQL